MKSYLKGLGGGRRSEPTAVPATVAPAQVPSAPARPGELNVLGHPLGLHALGILRDRRTSPSDFRRASHQLLLLLILEATRGIPVQRRMLETFDGPRDGPALGRPVVLLTVTRDSIGVANDLAAGWPDVCVGTVVVAATPRMHLPQAPALGESAVLVFAPVISSGRAALTALELARRSGAADVSLVCFIASLPGLSLVQGALPQLPIWTAAVDTEYDATRGPLPGVGVLTQRLYG